MSETLNFVRRLGANAQRVARGTVAQFALPRGPGVWLRIRLSPPMDELRMPLLPWVREAPHTLLDVIFALEAVADDPRVDGVFLRLAGAPRGWAKVMAVRRAVDRLRERGKPVVAYGDQLGAEDLLIAAGASRLWMPESGSLHLVGLRAEGVFLKGLLSRLGVTPDVVRVGGYKTAAETFVRESMSPEGREQTEAMLDDLYAELVAGIARGRGLSPDEVRARIDGGPYTAPAAVEAGLVDACLYPDELEAALAREVPVPGAEDPDEPGIHLVDLGLYTALRVRDPGWRPLIGDLPRFAYVVASGAIHRGRGLRGIALDPLRALLEGLRRDKGVRGVVLRISSPGGDSLASDLLWRAVQVVRKDKPVVVSMGDVAASGGYYLAAAADAVFAEAATVTGSIGVVGGKIHLEDLYDRIGVGRDGVERGARAGLLSDTRGFTPDERAAVKKQMQDVYDLFLRRVAEGRGLEPAQAEKVAGGRVWSGARAEQVGLVDRLGGPFEALLDVRRRAGLAESDRFLLDIHPRRPRLAGLGALLSGWRGITLG